MAKKKTDNEMNLVRKIASVAVNSVPLMLGPVAGSLRKPGGTVPGTGNLNIPTPPPRPKMFRQKGVTTVKPKAALEMMGPSYKDRRQQIFNPPGSTWNNSRLRPPKKRN